MSGCGLPSDAFGEVLFAACFASLALKRHLEHLWLPGAERVWRTFVLDASKQGFAALWLHLLCGPCTLATGAGLRGDGCEQYWFVTVANLVVAMPSQYFLLVTGTLWLEHAAGCLEELRSGDYADEKGDYAPQRYLKQLGLWLGCVTLAQSFLALLGAWLRPLWLTGAGVLLGAVSWSPGLEFAVVGVITPCCANTLQLWFTDEFLRDGGLSLPELLQGLGLRLQHLLRAAGHQAVAVLALWRQPREASRAHSQATAWLADWADGAEHRREHRSTMSTAATTPSLGSPLLGESREVEELPRGSMLTVEEALAYVRCPKGHRNLTLAPSPKQNFWCDFCRVPQVSGGTMFACLSCTADFCDVCVQAPEPIRQALRELAPIRVWSPPPDLERQEAQAHAQEVRQQQSLSSQAEALEARLAAREQQIGEMAAKLAPSGWQLGAEQVPEEPIVRVEVPSPTPAGEAFQAFEPAVAAGSTASSLGTETGYRRRNTRVHFEESPEQQQHLPRPLPVGSQASMPPQASEPVARGIAEASEPVARAIAQASGPAAAHGAAFLPASHGPPLAFHTPPGSPGLAEVDRRIAELAAKARLLESTTARPGPTLEPVVAAAAAGCPQGAPFVGGIDSRSSAAGCSTASRLSALQSKISRIKDGRGVATNSLDRGLEELSGHIRDIEQLVGRPAASHSAEVTRLRERGAAREISHSYPEVMRLQERGAAREIRQSYPEVTRLQERGAAREISQSYPEVTRLQERGAAREISQSYPEAHALGQRMSPQEPLARIEQRPPALAPASTGGRGSTAASVMAPTPCRSPAGVDGLDHRIAALEAKLPTGALERKMHALEARIKELEGPAA